MRTVVTLTLIITGLWALSRLVQGFARWRAEQDDRSWNDKYGGA